MINNLLLILILLFTLFLSGVFAGSETGMYMFSSLRLRLGIERKKISFILLGKALKDRNTLLLSMLIGNNLTHYIITSIVTVLFLKLYSSENQAELITTLVTAPILFIFAELLPKSFFYLRADNLMPPLSPLLYFSHKVFCYSGIVYLLKLISNSLSHLVGIRIPSKTLIDTSNRPHIKAIFQEMEEEGSFSSVQKDIVNRLAKIPEVTVGSIMTPLEKAEAIELHSNQTSLLTKLKTSSYTRLLVYNHQIINIIGWINIYEALESPKDLTDMSSFVKKIRKLESETDIITAIKIMRREKLRIFLVIKTTRSGKETPLGIVTMKDLAEEFLGDLAEW
jgi:CBS domain containing-hemolysin-like protein